MIPIKPKFAAVVGSVVLASLALVAWRVHWIRGGDERALSMAVARLPAWTPRPDVYSASFNDAMTEIRNDLARRPMWKKADAERLLGYAKTPCTFSGRVWDDDVPLAEIEAAQIQDAAVAAVGERLQLGLPIETDARELLVAFLLEELDHPNWRERLLACTVVVQSGLADDPTIRPWIKAMTNDPDPDVAANAMRQLRHRDRLLGRGVEPDE